MNEEERLESLYALKVLDTGVNPEIERITNLASRIFSSPIVLVSLVDKSRQWLKSKVGLNVEETPREIAFCAHAIKGSEILEIPNAAEDDRFKENPLVTGDPFIRYYCGSPLIAKDGAALGTLCIIDRVPRPPMSMGKRVLLQELTGQVMKEIEQGSREQDTSELDDVLPTPSRKRGA